MKVGYCGIFGKPNVGKSLLLNRLLNTPLSAVSQKPQTTRHKILGILSEKDYQIIFLDTPGVLKPKYLLQEFMVKEIEESLESCDIALFVCEPFGPPDDLEKEIIEKIKEREKTSLVVINKVDLVKKDLILPLIETYNKMGFLEIYPISALKNIGIEELKEGIVKYLKEGEPYYEPDMISEKNERFFVSEFIREAIFNLYGEEIPYCTTVEVEEFKEREKGKDYIRATIYVEKPSQKKIIIGKDGKALKRLGEMARKRIEAFLGKEIYLELWIKVKENWRKDIQFIKKTVYGF
ncbi:MAG: GTPase Era [Candidatus Micrarchaeia archaeon]